MTLLLVLLKLVEDSVVAVAFPKVEVLDTSVEKDPIVLKRLVEVALVNVGVDDTAMVEVPVTLILLPAVNLVTGAS
jgi:hypothetical protein